MAEPSKKRGRPRRVKEEPSHGLQESEEPEVASQQPSTPIQPLPKRSRRSKVVKLERNEGEDGAGTTPVSIQKTTEARELYLSYKGRIDEFRRLESKDIRRIIRNVFMRHSKVKTELECLQCSKSLSTPDGMIYHIAKCTLTNDELLVTCSLCSAKVQTQDFADHLLVHNPAENPDTPEGAKRRSAVAAIHKMDAVLGRLQDPSTDDTSTDYGSTPIAHPIPCSSSPRAKTSSGKGKRLQKFLKLQLPHSLIERIKKSHLNADDQPEFYRCECSPEDWIPYTGDDDIIRKVLPFPNSIQLETDNITEKLELFKAKYSKTNGTSTAFCGGPVSAIAWSPRSFSAHEEIVAVSCFRDADLLMGSDKDIVQFWKVSSSGKSHIGVEPKCLFGLVHDQGTTLSMQWCPFGAYDDPGAGSDQPDAYPLFGILALGTSTGCVLIYCIPHLDKFLDVKPKTKSGIRLFEPHPLMVLTKEEGSGPILEVQWRAFPSPDNVSKLLTKSSEDIVTVWSIIRRDEDLVACSRNTVISEGQINSALWIDPNSILVTFADKDVGVIDTESDYWLYRSRDNNVIAFNASPLGPGIPGAVVWPDNKLSKFAGMNFPDESWLLMWDASSSHTELFPLSQYHVGTVWDMTFCPKNRIVASVDNGGVLQVTKIDRTARNDEWQRHELKLEIGSKPQHMEQMAEYEDCVSNCTLQIKKRPKVVFEYKESLKQFYMAEGRGEFPISAFFRAAFSSSNAKHSVLCVGAQSGFLIFIPVT